MKDRKLNSSHNLASFLLESSTEISALMATIGNEKRMQIMANLVYERHSLADLQERTGFAASMLNNHLAILLEAGLVKRIDRGQYDISMDGSELLQQLGEVFLDMKIREKQRLEYLQALVGRYQTFDANKGDNMTTEELTVNIVELQPFSYVSFHALGTQPENEAFEKMTQWIEAHGYRDDMSSHPVYGFNNPDPKEGQAEYGYEVWVQVDPAEISDREVRSFDGGRYAVTTTKLFPLTEDNIIPAWPRLVKWAKNNQYTLATHQWLEKSLTPFDTPEEVYLDLYLPIE